MTDPFSHEEMTAWMRRMNMPDFAVNVEVTWQECAERSQSGFYGRMAAKYSNEIDRLQKALQAIADTDDHDIKFHPQDTAKRLREEAQTALEHGFRKTD